jgi:glycosyltransferase involved in cell wall biosynthesis
VFEKYNGSSYYVAISDADRHESLDYVATIHHGIDMGEFELEEKPGDYLLFFGRIHPDKGTVEAIDVAERTGMPLVIAGIVQDRDYFEQLVEPLLDCDRVSYVGPVGADRRGGLLGGARALLHLVNFDEPFGFSVVEAMACGTPVIAPRRGSMPEIIRHGENGFLVDTEQDAAAAVHASASLDRTAVRASVEGRFHVERMVDDYLAVYQRVVELHRDKRTGIEALR